MQNVTTKNLKTVMPKFLSYVKRFLFKPRRQSIDVSCTCISTHPVLFLLIIETTCEIIPTDFVAVLISSEHGDAAGLFLRQTNAYFGSFPTHVGQETISADSPRIGSDMTYCF